MAPRLFGAVERLGRRVRRSRQFFPIWGAQVLAPQAMWRRSRRSRVIYVGVTGSCGKTTTTRLIGAVLSSAGECRTEAGRNGLGGVVINVLSVGAATKFCAQEISGSSPGRIKPQVRVLRPHIGVVTTVGSDHHKTFRSLEATATEKAKLVESLPRDGIAVLNADDPHVLAMAARTRARIVTYGLSPEAAVRGSEVRSAWPDRLSLTVTHGERQRRLRTQLVGEYWATSVLAAVACGIACGLDLDACADAVARFEPVFGRSSVHSVPGGPDYILETQKAPLWTMANSMTFVREARAPRKTMVIGTVSDYSGKGGETHRKVARLALEAADRVVFVGPHADHVDRLRLGGNEHKLFSFLTSHQAAAFLAEAPLAGELIHIKASITDHLERIMLAQFGGVVCWRERCMIESSCPDCRLYRRSHQPPFSAAAQKANDSNEDRP